MIFSHTKLNIRSARLPTAITAAVWRWFPPIYYRHICKDGLTKFKRFAVNVWGISENGKTDEEIAFAGIDALAEFIKEIGLPTTLRELGMTDKSILPEIAASCNASSGSYGDMNKEKILEILNESF